MVRGFLGNSLFFVLQKRFLPSSTAASALSSTFTVQFLHNSCGVSLESSVSTSSKICKLEEKNLNEPQAVAVLEFFKSHGFDNTHLNKLIEKFPQVLHCRLENNLKPKIEFFTENGFVGRLLHELILSSPDILFRSLDSHIKPSIEFLRRFIDSNEKIVVAIKNCTWLATHNLKARMKPNIEFLLKEGVPAKTISRLIVRQARVVLMFHDKIVDTVKAVKNLGLQPEAPAFAEAIRVMLSISESNFRKKMEVLKSMGWTEEEILLAFKRVPSCLATSEEKLRSGLAFYANNLNWGPKTIIAHPALLTYSLDKRIRPRYNVLKVLESKKLIKMNNKTTSWASSSEDSFLKSFVMKYADEIPDVLKLYLEKTKHKR